MKWLIGVTVVLLGLALFLLAAEQPAQAQIKEGVKVTGKVTALKERETISLELANAKVVTFNFTKFTKVTGELAVGVTAAVEPGDNPKNARSITVLKK